MKILVAKIEIKEGFFHGLLRRSGSIFVKVYLWEINMVIRRNLVVFELFQDTILFLVSQTLLV